MVALTGVEPRPLFAFAGIWRQHKGPIKKDGPVVELNTYSFMTTVPNALTSSINHERSPVLLTNESEWSTWLNGTPEEALTLVKPIAAERLHIVREGFEKHDDAT
jgi:putative SOS response-associated peptidase YedK